MQQILIAILVQASFVSTCLLLSPVPKPVAYYGKV